MNMVRGKKHADEIAATWGSGFETFFFNLMQRLRANA
jgi:hypothetical protein